MRVGLVGTGAIANMHARAYKNIGFDLITCYDIFPDAAKRFADRWGCQIAETMEDVCSHPQVDYVELCTFPDVRLDPVRQCAANGKHVQVQKPMATNLETAREMIEIAEKAGITLGVVSQHRFDDSMQFLHKAVNEGRLGKILQADAYVKWHRSEQYYSRPIKGSWGVEGGGALINQGIHQVDMLQWLFGPVKELFAYWQLGALHKIESEDVVCALLQYGSGATGVIQSATAFWPGYTERLEIHGAKGSAIVSGDKLTTWDVRDDSGDPAPLSEVAESGASDPMAIPVTPFERQFLDFADACKTGRPPLVSGQEGYKALEVVLKVYESCREGQKVTLG